MKTTSVRISLKKYGIETVRYAAYALSGGAHVFIEPDGPGAVRVNLSPKAGTSPSAGAKLAGRLATELEDEALRARISSENAELREFLLRKALLPRQQAAPAGDPGLTPEQEKELDALIAQVEREIKTEGSAGPGGDPLGLTKVWEEKYAPKRGRKTAKK